MLKPCIELVFNDHGILVDAYAIHDDEEGTRAVQLSFANSSENINVDAPSMFRLNINSFRVKRTHLDD